LIWDGALPEPDPDYAPEELQRQLADRIAAAMLEPAPAAHRASGLASMDSLERLGARPLTDIPDDPPAPLLLDRLDPSGHTLLYGTGGVGKGVVTASWVGQLAAAGERVVILDYENHPAEWSRRVAGLFGRGGREGILWVAPLAAGWQGRRGPLWAQADDLAPLLDAWRATYLVIDSIVPACGPIDPTKPEAAAQYAGALEFLGRPTLSLGHVTKAESLAYPFGSAFWHNLARVTWSIARVRADIVLTNRKHNNGSRLGRFGVTVTWRDGVLGEVWERPYAAVLADEIDELLGDGPATVASIVERLNADNDEGDSPVKVDSVRSALRRGRTDRFAVEGSGTTARWGRRS
jgi:hypothetical protein